MTGERAELSRDEYGQGALLGGLGWDTAVRDENLIEVEESGREQLLQGRPLGDTVAVGEGLKFCEEALFDHRLVIPEEGRPTAEEGEREGEWGMTAEDRGRGWKSRPWWVRRTRWVSTGLRRTK